MPPGEEYLAGTARRRWALAAVIALAVLARLTYFLEAYDSPLTRMHLWEQSDMNYYDSWAKRILGGDLLSAQVPPPMHDWQRETAGAYLREFPQKRPEIEAAARAAKSDAESFLWQEWLGPGRFYQEPAYPYLVALTYAAFGPDPRAVFIWQLVLGVLGVWLLYRIAERHFDSFVAAVAGGLAAVASAPLMHEMTLLRDGLVVFMGLLVLDRTDLALARGGWRRWGLVGLALGFALMTKGIFGGYGLGLLALIVWTRWRKWKELGAALAGVSVGLAAALSPMMARNAAVGVAPLALAGNAGFGFIQNDAPDYRWESTAVVSPEYFPRLLGQTGGRLLPGVVATLKAHPGVGSVVNMVWSKFDASWHWWERPDNANIYYYRLYAPILGLLPFTLLAAPALAGLVLAARRFRPRASLYLLVATGLAPLVIFNVMARYRLVLLAASLPFAAYFLVSLVRWAAERRRRNLALGLAALAVLYAWTARPLTGYDVNGRPLFAFLPRAGADRPVIRPVDCFATWHWYCEPKAAQEEKAGNPAQAAETLADWARHEPDVVGRIGQGGRRPNLQSVVMADWYSEAHAKSARLYAAAGRPAQAAEQLGRAAEILERCLAAEPMGVRVMGPGLPARTRDAAVQAGLFSEIHGRYGQACRSAGKSALSAEHLRRADELRRAAGGR